MSYTEEKESNEASKSNGLETNSEKEHKNKRSSVRNSALHFGEVLITLLLPLKLLITISTTSNSLK